MSRLFVGPREQQFINDITKEFTKDIAGQFIVYYPVSLMHTNVHKVYREAINKVFENPIKLDVLAGQPQRTQQITQFGGEVNSTLELFVQARDLLDKDLELFAGDFFVYGNEIYEVYTAVLIENIYGQVEYDKAVRIEAQLARAGQFNANVLQELLEQSKFFKDSAVHKKFVQQRGLSENEEGFTNDYRELRDRLGDGMADIALGEGPRKVDVDQEDECDVPLDVATDAKGSGFYNE